MADLLNLGVERVFYDTTLLHLEVAEEDQSVGEDDLVQGGKAAGTKLYPAPRKWGCARSGGEVGAQIVAGLAVTREGFPVRKWVFPGNTVDVWIVPQVKEDLRGGQLSRCVFVGDAGMVSEDNLRTLGLGGAKYIVCTPIHQRGEVDQEVLARPGRYQVVAQKLRVKQVEVGDGERRRRHVVCSNPQEEARQRAHRELVLAELEAELACLRQLTGQPLTKQGCELRASRRYGKYLK